MNSHSHIPPTDAVNVECRNDEWVVIVVENGNVFERAFTKEEFAAAYADGQRMWLG